MASVTVFKNGEKKVEHYVGPWALDSPVWICKPVSKKIVMLFLYLIVKNARKLRSPDISFVPTEFSEIKLEKTAENKCELRYDTWRFIKTDTLFFCDFPRFSKRGF